MKIGIAGSNVAFYSQREPAFTLIRTAEEAGVESLWTFEHVVVPAGYASIYPYDETGRMPGDGVFPLADPLGWLAFAAAVSENLRLATGVLILPEHNPVVLAKLSATIDQLSAGRLILGIGVGWLKEEFAALGVPWSARGARTDEYVEVLRTLWRDDEANFAGTHVTLDRARMQPKPIQPGGIPIIVGGHTDHAARRAGRLGDGFYPATTPEEVKRLIGVMRSAAEEAGRDPDAIELTSGTGPVPDLDTVRRYQDLGVTRLVVDMPTYDPSELPHAIELLHDRLISKLT